MGLYDTYFIDKGDPRVLDWPLMRDPFYVCATFILYILIVKFWGPKLMENRRPFDLRLTIALYDVTQVIFCAILFYETLTNGWLTDYKVFGCQNVDYSNGEQAVKMAELVWWTLLLKLYEFVETIFFVLRKKNNQISFLHTYHHVTTAALTWLAAKYVAGGTTTFPIMINCLVHIIMYLYYFLAIFGPDVQKKIAKWKPKLTLIQMVQFCIVLLHALYLFEDGCKLPRMMFYIYVSNIAVIFYMFYEFYNTTYLNKKHTL